MRIAIATVQVPFVSGGAEYLVQGLRRELIRAGHDVDVVTAPFRFGAQSVLRDMDYWAAQDFTTLDIRPPEGVIALKFPAYYVQHPRKALWLLHQHRAVYDLVDTPWGESSRTAASLRDKITQYDSTHLGAVEGRFTIARTVTQRLQTFNGLSAQTLYHPPPHHDLLRADGATFPYIFAPSRLEELKRQDLLIRAMPYVDRPVMAVICGTGGMQERYRHLVHELGVQDRVKFTGHVSGEQIRRYYAHALGVFFAPYQEDLGYVTLEAMLCARPVLTCTDSGGPTEFVIPNETGMVCTPDPRDIAENINALWKNQPRARDMGQAGWQHYHALNISWNTVVETLTGALQ